MWLDGALRQVEYGTFWDPFDAMFNFKPSFNETKLPAIREPAESLTLDLGPIFDAASNSFATDEAFINATALNSFARSFSRQEMAFLDWQHQSYVYRPADLDLTDLNETIPVFPNGDYFVHAITDLSSGTFGHPWQQTLCIWGSPLVKTLGNELATWLPIVRRGGKPNE